MGANRTSAWGPLGWRRVCPANKNSHQRTGFDVRPELRQLARSAVPLSTVRYLRRRTTMVRCLFQVFKLAAQGFQAHRDEHDHAEGTEHEIVQAVDQGASKGKQA